MADKGSTWWKQHGLTIYSGPLMTSSLFSALHSRDLEECEVLFAKGWDLASCLGPAFCVALYCIAGWVHAMKGEQEKAVHLAKQALSFSHQSKSVYAEAGARLGLAHLLILSDCVKEAQVLLAGAPSQFQQPTLQYSLHLVRAQESLTHQEMAPALEHLPSSV